VDRYGPSRSSDEIILISSHIRFAVFGIGLIAATACAQTPNANEATAPVAVKVESPAQIVALGRSRYTLMCARCHGLNLVSNGLGTDLRAFPQDAKARFDMSVSKGLRAMPAWESSLKPGELDAMWAYIGSVNGWAEK
jgi:mono/diheme cytochrome c family protein